MSVAKNSNRSLIFLQNFFKPMKQILVLTLFQCILSDFFRMAGKNSDTGANHFLVKTPFTGSDTDSVFFNSVIATKNWN